MGWKEDIAIWARKNNQEPETVEAIAKKPKKETGGQKKIEGWNPSNYTSSMKKALFDYLDQWYTLSVKTLPVPATSLRRNPAQLGTQVKKYTKLSNGWEIWTIQNSDYTHSTVASDDEEYLNYGNNTLLKSLKIHKSLVKKLKN